MKMLTVYFDEPSGEISKIDISKNFISCTPLLQADLWYDLQQISNQKYLRALQVFRTGRHRQKRYQARHPKK
jgi:hypothetical protein